MYLLLLILHEKVYDHSSQNKVFVVNEKYRNKIKIVHGIPVIYIYLVKFNL